MKKIIKKVLFFVLLPTLLFILVTSIYENIVIQNKINSFCKNSILDEVNSTSSKKCYYKENSDYYSNHSYINPGNYCDILVTTYGAPTQPILHELVSWTIGGHAALVGLSYNDEYFSFSYNTSLETTINDEYTYAYTINTNSWEDVYSFPNYIILRVDLTIDQSNKIFNEAVSMLGDPYNFLFVTNYKNKSYCSDFVSKCFRVANININYDLGTTTVLDIAASNKTYIVGYKKYVNKVSYYYTY